MEQEVFQQRLEEDRKLVEEALHQVCQGWRRYADLTEAMEYSLLAGGKRIRPVLVLETCRLCGGDPALALPLACGVEMIHTYSLIHDDLPAMDDDDLRRGRPTNHKVYGEATAILAGDGLLTAAFGVLTQAELPAERVVEAVSCLSREAGPEGMVGGQVLDMAGEGRALTRGELEQLQQLKTGALISAAASIGQVCGWRDPLFSLSAAIALVVMYDACNVRRAAGEQAKVINYIREHWDDLPQELKGKKLNEELGHTLPQVLMGALLGTAIGLIGPVIW